MIGENIKGGGVGEENMYKSKEEELALTSLSKLYSELNAILVNSSKHFSYSTLHCLLTTLITNYYPNEDMN